MSFFTYFWILAGVVILASIGVYEWGRRKDKRMWSDTELDDE